MVAINYLLHSSGLIMARPPWNKSDRRKIRVGSQGTKANDEQGKGELHLK